MRCLTGVSPAAWFLAALLTSAGAVTAFEKAGDAVQPGKVLWQDEQLTPEAVAVRVQSDARLNEYEKRRSNTDDSVAGQLKLASWCRQNKLLAQEQAHLMRVLEKEPANVEARKLLGHKRVEGQWLTSEDIARAQARARAAVGAFKRYSKPIAAIAKRLDSTSEKARKSAEDRLAELDDPAVIPVIEAALLSADDPAALAFVEALGRMTSPDASVALARLATNTPSRDVRDAAVKKLKATAYPYFVPVLLASLNTPVESKLQLYQAPDGRLTYRHWYYSENQSERRALVFDQSFRRPRGGQVNDGDALAQRESAVAVAAASESLRTEETNERICKVLNLVTELNLPAKPEVWWSWWNEVTETALADEKPLYEQYVSREEVLADARRYYGGTVVAPGTETGGGGGPPVGIYECLVAGTPVWTARGMMAIEKIRGGDLVLSQDVETGALAYKPVLRTTERPPAALVEIDLPLETIIASGGHLFWTEGTAWQRARRCEPGMPLVTLTNRGEVADARPSAPQKTYNLIVADFHTYFVGKSKLLSHDNTPERPSANVRPGVPRDRSSPARTAGLHSR